MFAAREKSHATPAPFEGLRVVDLSDRLSGAFAARLFADFGADVVLAEPPEGHPLRHEPPFLDDEPGLDASALHAYANWNKQSVVVDSEARLRSLIANADVIVTTRGPLATMRFADSLDALAWNAVHLSVTPHGLDRPLSLVPGNNLTTCARSGWAYINGYQDEPPLQMPHDQAGYMGGITGFIAAAAALRRRQSGEAERVDVSELEALALTVHPWGIASIYADVGYCNGPAGRRPRGKPAPLWDLADGRMHFAIADFRNWQEAMQILELPEFADQKNLIADLGRHSQNLGDVVRGMARTLPDLKRWEIFHELAELRCVVGVVQTVADLLANEQNLARDYLMNTRVDGRTVTAPGAPAKLSPSPWTLRRPAPELGGDEWPSGQNSPDSGAGQESSERNAVRNELSAQAIAAGPLSGVRVLSFGQAWSGTFGAEILALLGADVVQIGALARPDVWRRVANRVPAGIEDASRRQHPLNTQGLYNSVNLNKREITLDLSTERGRGLLWQLIPRFDILVDNFRPTVLPGWGVSLEKLHELRPGMIWASISGYGEHGPYAHYPANGATTEPMSGLSSLHGYEGDAGMNTGGLFPDPVGGYFLAATIMAALAHRDRTGEPQRVDLSMMEAVTAICGDAVVGHGLTGRTPRPLGNHHPRVAPHNCYPTKGGEWLALAAESAAAWEALVGIVQDQRLSGPEFRSMRERKANEGALDEILGAWTSTRDAGELESMLTSAGIAAARVKPLYELYSRPDPDFQASGFVTSVPHPEAGSTWLPGRPWRFSAGESAPVRAAPCVGEHSREVLINELGLTEESYRELVAAGITGTLDGLAASEA